MYLFIYMLSYFIICYFLYSCIYLFIHSFTVYYLFIYLLICLVYFSGSSFPSPFIRSSTVDSFVRYETPCGLLKKG